MTRRINVVLPIKTIRVLDRVAPKGKKANLAAQLKAGAKATADRDLEMAAAWFSLDEEAWDKSLCNK